MPAPADRSPAGPPAGSSPGPGAEPPRPALLDRWTALLTRCQTGTEPPDPVPYGKNLLERWDEPQRRYHTGAHLKAVLDRIDELAEHADDPDAVRLAAWFHDAVYRPDRSENEERSARLAQVALAEAGVGDARVAEVARLVRLTVGHDPRAGDRNGEVLCDADLAVLAGTPAEYAAYAAAVREEYGFVPDDAFREGRAAVLRQLLGLPRLFRTEAGYGRWEAAARHNVGTELELLAGRSGAAGGQ